MRLEWTPMGEHQVAGQVCVDCRGDGWQLDHADECYEKGDCVGCGGVQVQCSSCGGTGRRAA